MLRNVVFRLLLQYICKIRRIERLRCVRNCRKRTAASKQHRQKHRQQRSCQSFVHSYTPFLSKFSMHRTIRIAHKVHRRQSQRIIGAAAAGVRAAITFAGNCVSSLL